VLGRGIVNKELLTRSSKMIGDAALKTAEEILKEKQKDLTVVIALALSPAFASVISAFSVQFVLTCLQTLSNCHKSDEILKCVSKLIAIPLSTGLIQLRTAVSLENTSTPESHEQREHRISRYRDALCSLDQALSLAEDSEKAAIHLYRAFVSTKIPGADREARMHASEFKATCIDLEKKLSQDAAKEETQARKDEFSATQITVETGVGGGGGLASMSISTDRLRKAQFEATARSHMNEAKALKAQVQELEQSTILLDSLLQ